jgi:hypothetical protein
MDLASEGTAVVMTPSVTPSGRNLGVGFTGDIHRQATIMTFLPTPARRRIIRWSYTIRWHIHWHITRWPMSRIGRFYQLLTFVNGIVSNAGQDRSGAQNDRIRSRVSFASLYLLPSSTGGPKPRPSCSLQEELNASGRLRLLPKMKATARRLRVCRSHG